MQKKIIAQYGKMIMPLVLLSFHVYSYSAVVAYIPHALRACIDSVQAMVKKTDNASSLQALSSMINENRILTSDTMVRKAVQEALSLLENNKKSVRNADPSHEAIKRYLNAYVNSLDTSSVLLSLEGDESQRTSWLKSLIADSLISSVDIDMMCLSSELTAVKSMQLCGNAHIDLISPDSKSWDTSYRSISANKLNDPSILFTPAMMTSSSHNMPNIMFGTGLSSPVMTVWAMQAESNADQSPINVQFAVPGDFKTKKAVSLELHFLVKKQLGAAGKARIRVSTKSISQNGQFNIFDSSPTFSSITDSEDFDIIEPLSSDRVSHIAIKIPLDNEDIYNQDLLFLSFIRIEPQDCCEYSQDIYLASAQFIYTPK